MNDSLFFCYARLQLFSLDQRLGRSSFRLQFIQHAECTLDTRHIHFIKSLLLSICLHIIWMLCSATETCIWIFYRFHRPLFLLSIQKLNGTNECNMEMIHNLKSFSKPLHLCIGLVSCDNADSVSPVTPPYTHSSVENILKWLNCKSSFLRVHLFDRKNKTEQEKILWRCSVVHDDESIAYTITHNDGQEKKIYWIPFDYLIFVVVL